MSAILNSIKNVIAQSVSVEVKAPVTRNGKTKYPVLVTDMSQSFTSGWYIQYNPTAQDNGTRLYDGSATFSELNIANYSQLHNMVLTANYYFLQGHGVTVLGQNRSRAIYEPSDAVRLTVTSQPNSVSVVATIVDQNSPFHMMSITFTVVNNQGQEPYIVGSDKYWDRNTDMFKEYNANFAPRKARFFRLVQNGNQPETLRAKIAVKNGQYAINHDGTFEVSKDSKPEYIQTISNEFKALAFIYEQAIISIAFERAIQQGLPQAQPVNNAPAPNNMGGGFTPAFGMPGLNNAPAPQGTGFAPPAPAAPAAPAPGFQQNATNIPLSNQVPPAQQQAAATNFAEGTNFNVNAPGTPAPAPSQQGVGGFPAQQQPADGTAPVQGVPAPGAPAPAPNNPAIPGAPASGGVTETDLPWNTQN